MNYPRLEKRAKKVAGRWSSFSLKRLLLSFTLIVIGLGFQLFWWRGVFEKHLIGLLIWIASSAMLGAGLFTPFGKPWIGVLVGWILCFSAIVIFMALAFKDL